MYAAIASLDRAARRPFWFDEILTMAVSTQPSAAAIWQTLEQGADSNPPLFHFIEHMAGRIPIDRHIAFRLPSIAAFCLTLPALVLFVRRSVGEIPALVAVTLTLTMQLFTTYAVEARPYSMVACAVAWALVMWQRADRGPHFALASGAFLCTAVSLHYYAVLALFPVIAAEFARWVRTRQVRALIWFGLLVPLVALALLWPLASHIRADFAPHFWARPPIAGFLRVYDLFLNATNWYGAAATFALIGTLTVSTVRTLSLKGRDAAGVLVDDQILVVGLLLLPPVTYLAAHVAGVGVTARYVIPSALGIAAGTAFGAASSRYASLLIAAALSCVVVLRGLEEWYVRAPPADRAMANEASALETMIRDGHHGDLALAISNGHTYLPLAFYRSLPGASLVYLTDRQAAVRYTNSDTMELNIQRVGPLLSLNVQQLDQFTGAHDRFLVYAGRELWDWLPNALVERSFRLQIIARSANHRQELLLAERVGPVSSPKFAR